MLAIPYLLSQAGESSWMSQFERAVGLMSNAVVAVQDRSEELVTSFVQLAESAASRILQLAIQCAFRNI